MRQRKPVIQRKTKNNEAQKLQDRAFFNLEGRNWLERQISMLGRGRYLLRKMSVRTPAVKAKAVELSQGKSSSQAANNIIKFVANPKNVELVNTGWQTLNKFYNKQTADDAIKTKKIPTIFKNGQPIAGCNVVAATVAGLLRSAKPKSGRITDVFVVRTISPMGQKIGSKNWLGTPHTIVIYKINGVSYVADAFNHGRSFFDSPLIKKRGRINIKTSEISKQITALKKQGNWKVALDPQEFGLHTLQDYLNESIATGSTIAQDIDLQKFMRTLRR